MEKEKQQKTEVQKEQNQEIEDYGQVTLEEGEHRIRLLNIIGEIEGHECLASNAKTTKYEHVIPQLAALEGSPSEEGLLVLINTVGGDVESGLAIAEMIASLSKPTVSLVWGAAIPLCAIGSFSGLFFYCSHRNHDDSSGADDRIDYRRSSDL